MSPQGLPRVEMSSERLAPRIDLAGTTLSKRLACVRCHAQKLRCPRREPNENDCTRCVQAGVKCVDRTAQRMGRPNEAGIRKNTGTQETQNLGERQLAFGELTSHDANALGRRKGRKKARADVPVAESSGHGAANAADLADTAMDDRRYVSRLIASPRKQPCSDDRLLQQEKGHAERRLGGSRSRFIPFHSSCITTLPVLSITPPTSLPLHSSAAGNEV
jgi:hypothetical protein